jgi:hypothetical protein
MQMKSSLLIRTAIAILAANCVFTHPAAAADEITTSESAITGPTDQAPPMDMIVGITDLAIMPVVYIEAPMDGPSETGGPDPIPVSEELVTVEMVPEPPLSDQPAPVGEVSEPPVPEGQFVFFEPKEPQRLDEPVVAVETPESQLPDEPIRVVYYSLGGDGFDPTVLRSFGLEEDPAAAAVERVMTKVIDQAADTAVQPLTPAPL